MNKNKKLKDVFADTSKELLAAAESGEDTCEYRVRNRIFKETIVKDGIGFLNLFPWGASHIIYSDEFLEIKMKRRKFKAGNSFFNNEQFRYVGFKIKYLTDDISDETTVEELINYIKDKDCEKKKIIENRKQAGIDKVETLMEKHNLSYDDVRSIVWAFEAVPISSRIRENFKDK